MAKDFDSRFTHALLMVAIVLLTRGDPSIWGIIHAPLLVTAAFVWADVGPRLMNRSVST